MMNLETYEYDFNNNNNYNYNINNSRKIPHSKNVNNLQSNEILHSMKESLDNFLLNLRTKSSSNNISKEELENYYLSQSELYNSLNVDLISPYQSLVKQNIKTKNKNIRKNYTKKAYSTNNLLNNNNNSMFNMNNKNNISYIDKNIKEKKINNSVMYNNNNYSSIEIDNNLNKKININNNNDNNNSKKNFLIVIKLIFL